MLYCDLLVGALHPNERLQNYVEEIRKASAGGGALIQQLLAVARNQPGPSQRLCLNDVMVDSRDLLSRLIGEDIELICDLADDLGEVELDPAEAQQLILNLVLNARDALPEGGEIRVSTRNAGRGLDGAGRSAYPVVELSVEDTGGGLDARTRRHIFERFYTTKAPGRGNGLGLSIVAGIVTRCGGTIQVESEPGRGTRVIIRLPAAKPMPVVKVSESEVLQSSPSPARRVSESRRRKTA